MLVCFFSTGGHAELQGLYTGWLAGYQALILSALCCLQGVGGGLPDAALPAERHLVVGPHVSVGSVATAGLPLLLPQHGAGPAHHHPALHTGQKGASRHVREGSDVMCGCVYVCRGGGGCHITPEELHPHIASYEGAPLFHT